MSVAFDKYAAYYDLLYRDKDYRSEAEFVRRLVDRHAPGANSVLNLGCGTGSHDLHLAAAGFEVHGIDASSTMLERARDRLADLDPDIGGRVHFALGDVRECRVGRTFDVVSALFHVVSYQTSNDDLLRTFATAGAHLSPGGVFLFDYWYTSAVLAQGPSVRVKRIEDDSLRVVRIAEPTVHDEPCIVAVDYSISIEDKVSAGIEHLRERHVMRHFNIPEIDLVARVTGFRIVESGEWLTERRPGPATWSVYSVAVKNGDG